MVEIVATTEIRRQLNSPLEGGLDGRVETSLVSTIFSIAVKLEWVVHDYCSDEHGSIGRDRFYSQAFRLH